MSSRTEIVNVHGIEVRFESSMGISSIQNYAAQGILAHQQQGLAQQQLAEQNYAAISNQPLPSLSGVDLRGAAAGFQHTPPATKPADPALHRALLPRRQPIGLRYLGDM